jgi:hypothetical protein
VITELTTAAGETPDVFGLGYTTMLVECKATRSDFLADSDKPFRRNPEQGLGDLRYYFAPEGVIRVEELPANWGLVEVHGKQNKKVALAVKQPKDDRLEMCLVASAFQRLNIPEGNHISAKFYRIQSKCRATITVDDGEIPL